MAAKIFISYSHADGHHIDRLHKHLAQLEREGDITGWFDQEIHAGGRLDSVIQKELEDAQIFLACVSPDYIASEYCYEKELAFALEAEASGKMAVVPLILEPCEWLKTPLQKFKAVPTDGKPVADFTNPNAAFLNVVSELRRLVGTVDQPLEIKSAEAQPIQEESVRSRYRIKRDHDELHKRDFVDEAAREIYRFFKTSVEEISQISEIEARLSDFDGAHFQCTLINRGKKRAFETLHVRIGGSFGEIDTLYGDYNQKNTSHGGFSVQADDFELFFSSLMFGMSGERERMSSRQVAQYLWDDLLGRVGITYAADD